jgi:hypothetical protein
MQHTSPTTYGAVVFLANDAANRFSINAFVGAVEQDLTDNA